MHQVEQPAAMLLRALIVAFVALAPGFAHAVTVKTAQGPQGTEVWLSEEHTLPMIAVNISLPAGSAYDPDGKAGLASMMASLLDEGAGDLDSDAFKQALEARAIRIGASADRDYITVSMTTLRENADEAFRLLGLVLSRPRFDQEAVERMRVAILAGLRQEDENPSTVASKAWFATYFGTHPYAHSESGTPSGVQAITISDIKAFATEHMVRDRVKVAVAGDINDADLRRYLQQLFTSMPTKTVAVTPRASEAARPSTNTIPRNEPAPVAVFGFSGPMRLDPDFIPTFVANYIVGGGGFSSRLMDEVREKRGLVYGIGTDLWTFDAGGLIAGQFQTDPDKVAQAIDIVRTEWKRMASEGPTQQELDDAKTYLLGYYPRNFTNTMDTAQLLRGLQTEDLGIDYVTRRQKEIAAVTIDDAKRAAKRLFDASALTFVVVGPADQIKLPDAEVVKAPASN